MDIKPFWEQNQVQEPVAQAPVVANMDGDIGVDFSFFSSDSAKHITTDTVTDKPGKKRTTRPKVAVDGKVMPDKDLTNPIPGAAVESMDYAGSYMETSSMLRGAIAQADELNAGIMQDIQVVRDSKTLKSRYTYLTNLTSAAASTITAKISAIREINSSITQAHNLELNRLKALKVDKTEANDDMKMMDIYSAFVNTPIGVYTPNTPSFQDITTKPLPGGTVNPIEMIPQSPIGQQQLTAEQARMRMENNPNIQVVVRFNQATGQRCFDVIDKTTGMSIPNYPRPDAFLLEDTTIDVHTGVARNRNINAVYPLIMDNGGAINEY